MGNSQRKQCGCNNAVKSSQSCSVCKPLQQSSTVPEYVTTTQIMPYSKPKYCRHFTDKDENETGQCSFGYRNADGSMSCETKGDCKAYCQEGLHNETVVADSTTANSYYAKVTEKLTEAGSQSCKKRSNPQSCDQVFVSLVNTKNGLSATGIYTCEV